MVSVWPVNCLGSALRLGPAVQGGVQQAVALLQALYHLGRHSWALVFSDSLKLLQLIGQVERGQDRQPADVRRPTLPPQRAHLGVQRVRQLADVVGVGVWAGSFIGRSQARRVPPNLLSSSATMRSEWLRISSSVRVCSALWKTTRTSRL